ncbi:MAG: alpha/beta fold hydrolase [Woeseiaceae bacterium]|nr:alpha/beta fold hydrolase [Woeseiaceae bacterium]
MNRSGLLLLCCLLSLPAAAELELEDCRISAGPAFPSLKARCGTLARPVDPDEPGDSNDPDDSDDPDDTGDSNGNDRDTLELRVVVVPALNLEPAPDPILPIAGGPGQGSVEFYASYAHAFEHVRRDRDIVLVDQRGTGESAALDCPVDDAIIEGQYSVSATKTFAAECLEALAFDPRFFTTSVAVRDLDAVRRALGIAQWNVYGISYGSRVAQHYARRYPQAVRTLTLDGVVPPQLALGPDIAIASQNALDQVFARCAEDAACSERFPELEVAFSAVIDRLESKPVNVTVAHPVSGERSRESLGRQEFAAAVRLLLYHPHTVAMLPLLISEAADGNFRPIAAQYQMAIENLNESLSLGMHNAVMCTEDAPFFDEVGVDRQLLASSYLGPMLIESLEAMCSVWPAGIIDEELKAPLATDVPTLLLSGTADPITPPAYADLAAIGLRRAWLLTNPDQGHGQLGVGCMPRLYGEFVTSASLDGVDLDCRERAFVMPFFLSFSGPAP